AVSGNSACADGLDARGAGVAGSVDPGVSTKAATCAERSAGERRGTGCLSPFRARGEGCGEGISCPATLPFSPSSLSPLRGEETDGLCCKVGRLASRTVSVRDVLVRARLALWAV